MGRGGEGGRYPEAVRGIGSLLQSESVKARRAREANRPRTAASRNRPGQADPRLRQLQERYEIVMGAVNESVYDWDISRDRVYFAEGMERRLALPPGLLKDSFKPWHERIHPEDFARYREATVAHLKGATKRFECDYRYRARDGTWRWARTHGLAQRDARGRAVRMVGSTGDITELKQAEEALRKSEDRYALATSAAAEGIYEWDLETGRLFLTERAKALFSFPAEELTPGAWNRRIHGEDFAGYRQAIIDHFKGRTPQLEHEYRISDLQGDYRWVLERGIGVRNAEGRVVKMVGALTDITRRKRAELRLQRARDRAEEALEQQTATAEILRVISSSPADVQPVFEAVLSNALRLCEASFAAVFTFDGELVRNVAHLNASPEFARFLGSGGVRPSRQTTTRRCVLERRTIHTADLLNDSEFAPPEAQRREKVRTSLSVPMFRESTLVGVITLWRAEVKPFTERQIALIETFAAQAAIAIENVRLFNETKEALQQQTAISEILQVMSSSPTDVRPVLSAVAERAARLCEAEFVTVFMAEDGVLRAAGYSSAAASNPFPDGKDVLPLDRSYMAGRAAVTGQTVHLEDVVPLLESEFTGARENQEKFGFRTFLAVPLLRNKKVIGVIAASRRVVRRFSDKQVALVETFADQAAIAIENVRLFNETREALDQQAAIAEVLDVVTQLQTDVQPVFEAIGRNAARLCGALFSCVYRFDGELIHLAATHNLPPAATEVGRTLYPMRPDRSQLSGRAVLTRSVQRLEDADQDADYAMHVAVAGGWRRLLAVPMLREAEPLGVIAVGWRDPGPIPEARVELLKTFADQAVIAIEKVRLFNETREALEQQRALAEVLGTISRSVADAKPVFDLILDSCQRLFEGHLVGMTLLGEDGMIRLGAYQGENKEAMERVYPYPLARDSGSGQAMLERRVVHFPDVDSPGSQAPRRVLDGSQAVGFKSIVFAPLIAEERAACRAVQRTRDRAAADLRRPGGDRDPERAHVQRHARGTGAAEGFGRGPEGDQQLDRRYRPGVRQDPGELPAALRRHDRRAQPGARGRNAAHRRLPGRAPRGFRADLPDPAHPRIGIGPVHARAPRGALSRRRARRSA
jgi:PAS domain S-box-containing protein